MISIVRLKKLLEETMYGEKKFVYDFFSFSIHVKPANITIHDMFITTSFLIFMAVLSKIWGL